MMHSVGFDLIEIDRISQSIKNQRFLDRVYSPDELAQYNDIAKAAQSLAAAFAAKEAFSKALGTGVRGFSLCEVELLHDSLGAPYLRLNGRALDIANVKKLKFSVSLTHTKDMAGAVVIAEKIQ